MHVRSLRLFRKYDQVCLKRTVDILAKECDTRNQQSPLVDRLRQDAHHVGQRHSVAREYNQRGTYHACIVHNPKAHADTHACIRKQLDEQARERNRQNLERRKPNIDTSGSTTIRE